MQSAEAKPPSVRLQTCILLSVRATAFWAPLKFSANRDDEVYFRLMHHSRSTQEFR